ncbi:UvrD-helicase domain-containing protein [Klebsiella aerogenes]|nr:UvrD-helicase domain-containing protein [Klebsiella aerogenes]
MISEITTATYSHLLVDEYKDCNSEQHELACALSRLLPTVVFGDPMQCIFSFSGPMPDWNRTITPAGLACCPVSMTFPSLSVSW